MGKHTWMENNSLDRQINQWINQTSGRVISRRKTPTKKNRSLGKCMATGTGG